MSRVSIESPNNQSMIIFLLLIFLISWDVPGAPSLYNEISVFSYNSSYCGLMAKQHGYYMCNRHTHSGRKVLQLIEEPKIDLGVWHLMYMSQSGIFVLRLQYPSITVGKILLAQPTLIAFLLFKLQFKMSFLWDWMTGMLNYLGKSNRSSYLLTS